MLTHNLTLSTALSTTDVTHVGKIPGSHCHVHIPELKLIFVPLIFLLPRVWSFVIDIPAFYMPEEIWLKMRSTWTAAILSLLSVSLNHWSSQRLYISYVINSALCLGSQNLQNEVENQ